MGTIDLNTASKKLYGKAVLLIDDEELMINLCGIMLERLGCSVFKAKNGADGIDLYKRYRDRISLIISDLNMPEMNGPAVMKKLRRLDPQVKVILSSGALTDENEAEILNMGFDAFLPKPYSIKALDKKMGEILN
jgi:CheY-like chemotaxis protein